MNYKKQGDIMASRQYREQEENVKNGKCRYCRKPLSTKFHCEKCAEKIRARARNQYRAKVGIPLEAPLSKSGRPKMVVRDVMPLSYKAFCQSKQGILKPEEMRFDYIMIYLPTFPEFDPIKRIEKALAERKVVI